MRDQTTARTALGEIDLADGRRGAVRPAGRLPNLRLVPRPGAGRDVAGLAGAAVDYLTDAPYALVRERCWGDALGPWVVEV